MASPIRFLSRRRVGGRSYGSGDGIMILGRASNEELTALGQAMRTASPAFGFAIFLSFFINILALVAPIYMMQIYDRVIMSRNMTTLFMLTVIAFLLLISYALLEAARSRTLVR